MNWVRSRRKGLSSNTVKNKLEINFDNIFLFKLHIFPVKQFFRIYEFEIKLTFFLIVLNIYQNIINKYDIIHI